MAQAYNWPIPAPYGAVSVAARGMCAIRCIMYIEAWLPFGLAALCIWGVTAFLPKIFLRRIEPLHMLAISALFFFVVAAALQLYHWREFHFDLRGVAVAVVTGACYSLGQLTYLLALRAGPVTQVSMISSLYPAVTTLLAVVLLDEPLTARQCVAIMMGIGAILLLVLAGDRKPANVTTTATAAPVAA